jgi:hypothetical protein
MKSVKLLVDAVSPSSNAQDRWYVTNGATAVGPVNLDLLARGIESGKVPLESFIRHEAWQVWRPLSEIAVVTTMDSIAPAPAGAEATDDVAFPARPPFSHEMAPSDALAGASDVHEALVLLQAATVREASCDGVLIHRLHRDGALVVCAHGPRTGGVIGVRTRTEDPALIAAGLGTIIVAEPSPGPAGQAIATRLAKLGAPTEGALMIPIRTEKTMSTRTPHPPAKWCRLFGMIEMGRRSPFHASEIAALEALVEAFAAKVDAEGWMQ